MFVPCPRWGFQIPVHLLRGWGHAVTPRHVIIQKPTKPVLVTFLYLEQIQINPLLEVRLEGKTRMLIYTHTHMCAYMGICVHTD